MKRELFFQYCKRKVNLLMLVLLTVIAVINYYGTYLDWSDLQRQVSNPSVDLNVDAVDNLLTGYSGLTYFANLIFSSDFYVIIVVLMLMGFTAIVSEDMHQSIRTGYGNMIVVRCNYKMYAREIIYAQSTYICVVIWLFFTIQLVLLCVIWPVNWGGYITANVSAHLTPFQMLGYCGMHLGILTVYMCLIFIITHACTRFFKNKFALQALPLIIHFVPMLLAATLGNLTPLFAKIFSVVNTEAYLFTVKWVLTTDRPIGDISLTTLGITGAFAIIASVLYRRSCIRYEGAFL